MANFLFKLAQRKRDAPLCWRCIDPAQVLYQRQWHTSLDMDLNYKSSFQGYNHRHVVDIWDKETEKSFKKRFLVYFNMDMTKRGAVSGWISNSVINLFSVIFENLWNFTFITQFIYENSREQKETFPPSKTLVDFLVSRLVSVNLNPLFFILSCFISYFIVFVLDLFLSITFSEKNPWTPNF